MMYWAATPDTLTARQGSGIANDVRHDFAVAIDALNSVPVGSRGDGGELSKGMLVSVASAVMSDALRSSNSAVSSSGLCSGVSEAVRAPINSGDRMAIRLESATNAAARAMRRHPDDAILRLT